VNLPFPRQYRTEPKTPWGAHAAKVATAGRERTRYGYTQFDWVADVGRTHRASCPPGGRKASWRARALAGRKLEPPPDAGTSGEKAKRCACERRRSKVRAHAVHGFRLVSSVHDERRSWAFARLALTGKAKQGPSARGSSRSGTIREERVTVSASVGKGGHEIPPKRAGRACLRVTTGTSDGRHGSVKATRRSKGPRVVRILDAEKASVQMVRRDVIARS
jgi:hypothetical protein